MPSANQCELAGVYARYSDTTNHGGITEESITDIQSFDPCLGLEAGGAIFNEGAQYNLFAVLNDLSDSSRTAYTNTQAGRRGETRNRAACSSSPSPDDA